MLQHLNTKTSVGTRVFEYMFHCCLLITCPARHVIIAEIFVISFYFAGSRVMLISSTRRFLSMSPNMERLLLGICALFPGPFEGLCPQKDLAHSLFPGTLPAEVLKPCKTLLSVSCAAPLRKDLV